MKRILLIFLLFLNIGILNAGNTTESRTYENTNKTESTDNSKTEYYSMVLKIKIQRDNIISDNNVNAIEYTYLNKYLNGMAEKGYELHSITPVARTGYKIGIVYTSELILVFKKK